MPDKYPYRAMTDHDVSKIVNREVLTTYQVARVCRVAPRTVSKWVDSGKLKGYRIPGGERRVEKEDLINFCEHHGMPYSVALTVPRNGIMVAGMDERSVSAVRMSLPENWTCVRVQDMYEAGAAVAETKPRRLIVDGSRFGRDNSVALAKNLRAAVSFLYAAAIVPDDIAAPTVWGGGWFDMVQKGYGNLSQLVREVVSGGKDDA